AQQARRISPPEIVSPVSLKTGLEINEDSRIVLSEIEQSVLLKAVLARSKPPLALAFGPEGGWSAEETEMFRSAGWQSASLGSTILRAETAAIAAVAVTVAELL
ncbi:MAG: RsmE family RNA methyltransferase, partial [Candidatus Angelobacter sp.]